MPDEPDNKSARFNGEDSYIHVPDHAALNTGGPYTTRTWSLWFSADDASVEERQVLFEGGGSTRGINVYIQENQLYAGVWNRADDDSGVSSPWISGEDDVEGGSVYLSTPIESNTTYHVALVMDGDEDGKEGFLRGFLNGGMFQEKPGVGRLFAHGNDAGIGAVDNNTFWADENGNGNHETHFFAGRIDELAQFPTALTQGQIVRHIGIEQEIGDFNGDEVVDASDFTIMAENFNTTIGFPESLMMGDTNFDGRVDMVDFLEFREIFSTPQGAAAVAVPEPASPSLALVVAIAIAIRFSVRRKQRRMSA